MYNKIKFICETQDQKAFQLQIQTWFAEYSSNFELKTNIPSLIPKVRSELLKFKLFTFIG